MSARIRWTCLALAGLFGTAIFAAEASAQFSMSGTTRTGSFGSRTLGGASSSNRTGRSIGASNGSSFGSLSSQGGIAGALTEGAPSGERFVRGNRNGAFVGADSSDGALNAYSGMSGTAGGMGGLGGLGGGMMGNQMMMQAFRQNQQRSQQGLTQTQQNRLQVRVPVRVDSISAPPLTTEFTSRMTTRFANLPALKGKGNIVTVMDGDTLVLQGTVQTAADRKLAEDLLSLEPGVTQVRNELRVSQSESPAPASPSPASTSVAPASAEQPVPKIASRPLER